MSDDQQDWRKKLTEVQFDVCRLKGTEAPFSGEYWNHKEKGTYYCVCCGVALFSSQDKYDSGTGWPSYLQPIEESSINREVDNSHGVLRIEVLCKQCNSHLGHVFPDGPKPTGLRYCINSAALKFEKDK